MVRVGEEGATLSFHPAAAARLRACARVLKAIALVDDLELRATISTNVDLPYLHLGVLHASTAAIEYNGRAAGRQEASRLAAEGARVLTLHEEGCVRSSFRSALRELRRAYSQEDGVPVIVAYDEARRRSRAFRIVSAVLEHAYPARGFLVQAAELLDRAIAEEGLHAGCRRVLTTLALEWECRVPEAHEQTLRSAPIIFYGNHPSLLTPFLLAAGVDRPDLYFMSTSYVRRLIPSFSRFSFRLEVPLTRSWTEWKRGGFRRALVYRLLSLLHAVPSSHDAKAINQRALGDAATTLRGGGSIMIVPSGGGTRERHWFPGIGIIARSLIEQPGSEPVYVVPIREENCSNKQIYAILMRGPIARARRRRLYSRPVLLRFASPTPLIDVVGGAPTVDDAVAALRGHYERAFRIVR